MAEAPTTRWSLVLATRGEGAQAADALARLCEDYRPVLLAYFRRHVPAQAAEDTTQGFFVHFLEQRLGPRAEPERGSFRGYLYAAAEHYRTSELRAALSAKRGAGRVDTGVEIPEHADPAPDPPGAFDRDWALHLLYRARARLAAEAQASGRRALYEELEPWLAEAPPAGAYEAIGIRQQMAPNTVAVAVKRLRERLRAQVRAELADTLPPGADLDAEFAALKRALAGD